jgi:hypothetical protein
MSQDFQSHCEKSRPPEAEQARNDRYLLALYNQCIFIVTVIRSPDKLSKDIPFILPVFIFGIDLEGRKV